MHVLGEEEGGEEEALKRRCCCVEEGENFTARERCKSRVITALYLLRKPYLLEQGFRSLLSD
eukprot:scaffold6093_cov119-Ochromonas_danica.AAC.8